MDINNIKIFLKKHFSYFKFKRKYHRRNLIRPARDWKIILFIFSITNITIAIFSAYLFLQINKGEIFLVEPPQTTFVDTIDREKLTKTLMLFEEKINNFEVLKRNKPTLVDPAL